MKPIHGAIYTALTLFVLVCLPLSSNNANAAGNNRSISKAYKNKTSDVQVRGAGIVVKVLPDDNKGSRHQKFILKLSAELTVLIAHNIDLAPRIQSIKQGDTVEFYGEYEYSAKGGVIHWTHHDPARRHTGGWLKHNGKRYQ